MKTKYWMTDGYGSKALIEGADERDRWKPLGWSECDEPAGEDRVWLRHEEHGGRQRFPAAAVELWAAKGWHPSDPPVPESPFNADQPADVVPAATSTPTTDTSGPNTAAKSKEK
ncbi:hypothetical protein [Micromonospora sp. NPDC023633]|uniref:hypothetical protein n=1 Tax=Micromonospora sp. NPDC023633 TaxID=3154320 RepID=UPI0033E0A8EE